MADNISAEDLATLSPGEREAWEIEQKATAEPWICCEPIAYPVAETVSVCAGFVSPRIGNNTNAQEDADCICAARNLLPALLLKVARLMRENKYFDNLQADYAKKFANETALRLGWQARAETAESRVSDLTKEKDSALQERDRYKQERDEWKQAATTPENSKK